MAFVFSTPWFQTGSRNSESSGDITQLTRLEQQLEPHIEKLILTPKRAEVSECHFMYIFSKLKRSPFQGSIKKHLFKDSLLFFKKSMRSFSTFAVGPLKFPYFYWSIGLPVGRPQWGTSSWRWLWLQGRITPSPGGQVALSPALQLAASPVRPPPRRLHLIGAGSGQSLIREESPLRAILNQAPEIEVGMLKRQAARRKEKSCFKHIFGEF